MPVTTRRTSRNDLVAGDRTVSLRAADRAWTAWAFVGSALTLLLLLVGAGPAIAEPNIKAELNKVESVQNGCRMTLVLTNGLETSVDKLTLETVLFDTEQTVSRFLLITARPLPPGTMRVQQFDIEGQPCEGIGRVLINDVTACEGEGLDPARCLSLLAPSSRADVPFDAGAAGGE